MNRKKLIVFDKIFIFILLFFLPFLKIKNIFYKLLVKKSSKNNLIIKFIGSGNFYAIYKLITKNDFILTDISNYETLNKLNKKNIYYVDNRNTIYLLFSVMKIIFIFFFKQFNNIYVLEYDSNFASFIALLPFSKSLNTISRKYKNILNYIIFDILYVDLRLIGREKEYRLLKKFEPKTNNLILSIIEKKQKKFIHSNLNHLSSIKNILISPISADNDFHRSFTIPNLRDLINIFSRQKKIEFIFKNNKSEQFQYLNKIKKKKFKIAITDYKDYIKKIKGCDILISVDTQSVHIANIYNKNTIVIYGPSDPFAIKNYNNVYPIYNALNCSPCTHKYFDLPCNNKIFCMKIDFKKDLLFKKFFI